jgi:hypothetical protein
MPAVAGEPSSQAHTFRIRFRGALGSTWFATLQNASITSALRGRIMVSTLVGRVPDEAALIGIVNLLYQLGCPLISVESCRADEADYSEDVVDD